MKTLAKTDCKVVAGGADDNKKYYEYCKDAIKEHAHDTKNDIKDFVSKFMEKTGAGAEDLGKKLNEFLDKYKPD